MVRKNCSLKILNGRIGSLKVLNWKICNWKILNLRILNWKILSSKTGWTTGKMNCVMMKIWKNVSWSFGLLAAWQILLFHETKYWEQGILSTVSIAGYPVGYQWFYHNVRKSVLY